MYETLMRFKTLIKTLDSITSQISYTESLDKAEVQFRGKLVVLVKLLHRFTFGTFKLNGLDFYIQYNSSTILSHNDLKDIDTGIFNLKSVVILVIELDKKSLFSCKFDHGCICFLELEGFESYLETFEQDRIFNTARLKQDIYLPIEREYENQYIRLLPIKQLKGTRELSYISEESIEKVKITSKIFFKNIVSRENIMNPYVFYFEDLENETLSAIFNHLLFISITHYLCNYHHDNQFIFNGKKEVTIGTAQKFTTQNIHKYFDIFRFVYDEDKFIDKATIARNVFTVYLNEQSDLKEIDDRLEIIHNAVYAHFEAYATKKIDKYISNRKEIEKEAFKAATDLRNEADKMIQSISTTLLGLVTTGLVSIIAYTKGEKWIFLVAIAFFIFYVVINAIVSSWNYWNRGEEIKEQLDVYLKEIPSLTDKDINDIKDRHLSKPIKKLNIAIKIYIGASILIVVLLIQASLWISILSKA